MSEYVWQHTLGEGAERLRLDLMSHILDPTSFDDLARVPLGPHPHILEIGAGNGSLSLALARRVQPPGSVTVTDLNTDFISELHAANLDVRRLDVVKDGLPQQAYDLVLTRALLHHLPQRMDVVAAMVAAVRPGGWVFITEPDFHPTLTVQPPSQAQFWADFLRWAESHQIDYFVGSKVAPRLRELGCEQITVQGHTQQYNGGSDYAQWWRLGILEVAERMVAEGGTTRERVSEFLTLNEDPDYWTWTVCFTAVTARRPA